MGTYEARRSTTDALIRFAGLLCNLRDDIKRKKPLGTLDTLKEILSELAQRGGEISEAFLKEILKGWIHEGWFNLFGGIWSKVKNVDSGRILADNHFRQYEYDAINSYEDIIKTFVKKFKDQKFVLIIDQMERFDHQSLNFFVDIAERLPERVHLIGSHSLRGPKDLERFLYVEGELKRLRPPFIIQPRVFTRKDVSTLGTRMGKYLSPNKIWEISKRTGGNPKEISLALCYF